MEARWHAWMHSNIRQDTSADLTWWKSEVRVWSLAQWTGNEQAHLPDLTTRGRGAMNCLCLPVTAGGRRAHNQERGI